MHFLAYWFLKHLTGILEAYVIPGIKSACQINTTGVLNDENLHQVIQQECDILKVMAWTRVKFEDS